MKRVVTAEQMKLLDQYTIEEIGISSEVLMERAALAVVEELKQSYDLTRVLVVCGSGNNGGDGVAIARILHCQKVPVEIYALGKETHRTAETKHQYAIAEKYHVSMVNNPVWCEYTTIVDAIFGVGLSREISGAYETIVRGINASKVPVCAVDIPSGVSATTGQVLGYAIQAFSTVSFAFFKTGLLLYPGASFAGRCHVADIGIYEKKTIKYQPDVYALDTKDLFLLAHRDPAGNKGTFGKAFLIAGSGEMYGAAYLSAMACMRTGAGMIKILTSEKNRDNLQKLIPEAMLVTYESCDSIEKTLREGIAWADVVGVGPGIGQSETSCRMLQILLELNTNPLVMDADALNIVRQHPAWLKQTNARCMLTPHMGEMARLTGHSVEALKKDPIRAATDFAREYQVQLLLKDARTCTVNKAGQVYLNTSGNDGMATAGSGDVLTGILLALLCKKVPFDRAGALGVYLHGCAGDIAADRLGKDAMMARDIIDAIPYVYEEKKNGRVQ